MAHTGGLVCESGRFGKTGFQRQTLDHGVVSLTLSLPMMEYFCLEAGDACLQLSMGVECLLLVVHQLPDLGFTHLQR